MKNQVRLLLLSLALLSLVSQGYSQTPIEVDHPAARAQLDLAILPRFLEATAQVEEVRIYEGLPRDPETRAKDRKIAKIFDYEVYEPAKALDKEAAKTLRELLRKEAQFKEYMGPKMCGGFHPDFALEWRAQDGTSVFALVCLTCHEMILVRREEALLCDIPEEIYEKLKELKPSQP